jgi:DNA-binding CsgD family transcriptional regulator
MTEATLHHKNYLVEGGGFFTAPETRELVSWLQGLTVDEAAERSHTSPETVRSHRKKLREKTGQHTGVGVLTYCLVHGYIRRADCGSDRLRRRMKFMKSLRTAVHEATTESVSHGRH